VALPSLSPKLPCFSRAEGSELLLSTDDTHPTPKCLVYAENEILIFLYFQTNHSKLLDKNGQVRNHVPLRSKLQLMGVAGTRQDFTRSIIFATARR
jgi:hypothetical protein